MSLPKSPHGAPSLSVVIITKNEQRCIAKCLQSVAWADEIIVLDSGSTDGTVEICRTWTQRVYETDWPGYGVQKGRALAKATCDWVLSVDADEVVSDGLRREIEACMKDGRYAGYKIPRHNYFCGQLLRHGGWWPDKHPRLARRGRVVFNQNIVHEGMVIEGGVGELTQPLIHDGVPDLHTALLKNNLYSTLGAKMRARTGRPGCLTGAIVRGLWAFFRFYIVKLGFLDGRMGFVAAAVQAQGNYYRYVKLWLLHHQPPHNEQCRSPW